MQPMFLYSILLTRSLSLRVVVRIESVVVRTGPQRVVLVTPGWQEMMKKMRRVECDRR